MQGTDGRADMRWTRVFHSAIIYAHFLLIFIAFTSSSLYPATGHSPHSLLFHPSAAAHENTNHTINCDFISHTYKCHPFFSLYWKSLKSLRGISTFIRIPPIFELSLVLYFILFFCVCWWTIEEENDYYPPAHVALGANDTGSVYVDSGTSRTMHS